MRPGAQTDLSGCLAHRVCPDERGQRVLENVRLETAALDKGYRGPAAVEREFGRSKNEYGLAPLRVRARERVALHADLCILARLACALARARAVPLAA